MKIILTFILFLSSLSLCFAYTPPKGIPDPGMWGNTHPIDSSSPDPSIKCPEWPTGLSSGCYYIDSTSATCSDETNGYPNAPRCKLVDMTLPAGSYVEVHGGPYEIIAGDDELDLIMQGTASDPIWFRGYSEATRPTIRGVVTITGSYAIFENILFQRWSSENKARTSVGDQDAGVAHHIALRHSEWFGDSTYHSGFTAQITSGGISTTNKTHDIVFYDLLLHDFDDVEYALTDEDDDHAFLPGQNTYNIWILNSTAYNISGDGVQISGNNAYGDARAQYIYIGGNTIHTTGENAVDVKSSRDVIISENNFYNNRNGVSSDGTSIVVQQEGGDGSDNVWVLFNRIHDAERAVRAEEVVTNFYVIGNLIYDQKPKVDSTHSDCAHYFNGGYVYVRTDTVTGWIVDNTFYDYQAGIGNDNESSVQMNGNLFTGRAQSTSFDICSGTDAGENVYDHNLFDSGQPFMVRMGQSFYASLSNLIAGEGKCTNCQNDSSALVNPPSDFSLSALSPAIGGNMEDASYTTFQDRYGINIKRDYESGARPYGGTWDIGAYEYGSSPLVDTCTTNIDLCTEVTCEASGYYWWNDDCHAGEQPPLSSASVLTNASGEFVKRVDGSIITRPAQ